MTDLEPEANDPLLELCRSLSGTTEDVKWGDNLVFSVGKKMYAVFQLPSRSHFSFKVEPGLFESLTQQEGIDPAPYLARHSWVLVRSRETLPTDVVLDLLEASYALVASKLPKAQRRALGLETAPPPTKEANS